MGVSWDGWAECRCGSVRLVEAVDKLECQVVATVVELFVPVKSQPSESIESREDEELDSDKLALYRSGQKLASKSEITSPLV